MHTADGVDIATADAAALNGNVNVAVLKGLELKVLLLEGLPVLLIGDHEAGGGVVVLGVDHFDGCFVQWLMGS
jgi:hypothetical protein